MTWPWTWSDANLRNLSNSLLILAIIPLGILVAAIWRDERDWNRARRARRERIREHEPEEPTAMEDATENPKLGLHKTCEKCLNLHRTVRHDPGTRQRLCNECWFSSRPRYFPSGGEQKRTG